MIRHPRDFHFRAGKIEIGWNEKEVIQSRRQNFVSKGRLAQQRIVQGLSFEVLHSERAGGVALWVEINEQNALRAFRQRSPEIHGGRRFADAALLIRDGDDFHLRRGTDILSVGPAGVSPADLFDQSLMKAVRQNAGAPLSFDEAPKGAREVRAGLALRALPR